MNEFDLHVNFSLFLFLTAACDVIAQQMGQRVKSPLSEEPDNDILTPKAPSIAFPLANPPVAPEPQVKIHFLT